MVGVKGCRLEVTPCTFSFEKKWGSEKNSEFPLHLIDFDGNNYWSQDQSVQQQGISFACRKCHIYIESLTSNSSLTPSSLYPMDKPKWNSLPAHMHILITYEIELSVNF